MIILYFNLQSKKWGVPNAALQVGGYDQQLDSRNSKSGGIPHGKRGKKGCVTVISLGKTLKNIVHFYFLAKNSCRILNLKPFQRKNCATR